MSCVPLPLPLMVEYEYEECASAAMSCVPLATSRSASQAVAQRNPLQNTSFSSSLNISWGKPTTHLVDSEAEHSENSRSREFS